MSHNTHKEIGLIKCDLVNAYNPYILKEAL